MAQSDTTPPVMPGSALATAGALTDPALEADPDVKELKKAVRMGELKRQLEEISGLPGTAERLEKLEKRVRDLHHTVSELELTLGDSPLAGIRGEFECGCSAEGLVAVQVRCTACGHETSYGWFPSETN